MVTGCGGAPQSNGIESLSCRWRTLVGGPRDKYVTCDFSRRKSDIERPLECLTTLNNT